MNEFMNQAITMAKYTSSKNMGGPFGACVVKNGKVVAVASNSVLIDNDPTAHAEVNAIREACRRLKTYDLSGCELYATGYPCPMCLSAIMWANIKTVYYGTDLNDAEAIGFRDDFIYSYIRGTDDGNTLTISQVDREACLELFSNYVADNKVIY